MKKLFITCAFAAALTSAAHGEQPIELPEVTVKAPTYEQMVEDERLQTAVAACNLRIKAEARGEDFAECETLFKRRNVYRASIGLPPITE